MASKLPEIHIIYASTSGNVEWVCQQVEKRLENKQLALILHRAESTSIDVFTDNRLFILATSTWDHGLINPFFDELLEEMKSIDLADKMAGFIGLGDARYSKAHFAGGMDTLLEVFEKQGGKVLGVPLKMNGEPYEQMDKPQVNIWFEKFISALKEEL